jgi:quinol-cytochrome oxidoreductase complex cytochrome b subunit
MPTSENRPRDRNLELLLAGLLAGLAVVDVALLVAPAAVPAGPARLGLAVGAVGAVALGLALGVVGSPRYAIGAVVSVPFAALYAYTGLLLPWTQFSYWLGQTGLEAVLWLPVVGEPLAVALFGGFTLGEATLQAAFRAHYATVGLGVLAALSVCVSLFRRRSAPASRSSVEDAG